MGQLKLKASTSAVVTMKAVAIFLGVSTVGAVKLSSYAQGQKFEKCIANTDFETKTLDDDITLQDRDSAGCCPTGTVPGAKWQNNYQGAQVVCGFKADGTVALSTGSSNNVKTCTYNTCYVHKQNLDCKGDTDTKQKLNGCCGAAKPRTFKDECKHYDLSFNNVFSEKVNFCTTYHKNYGTIGWSGTNVKTDDQKDDKLEVDKIYSYSLCAGSAGAAEASGGDGGDNTNGAIHSSTGVAMMLAAIAMLMR